MYFDSATSRVPRMPRGQFDQLVDDIARHGQQVPIVVVDDFIVDGRERYDACIQLGIEPAYIRLTLDDIGGDVQRYVNQMNVLRRHLPSQLAIVSPPVDPVLPASDHVGVGCEPSCAANPQTPSQAPAVVSASANGTSIKPPLGDGTGFDRNFANEAAKLGDAFVRLLGGN